ncbi:Hpt domain-containing protein, partial [Pseudomonas aeruginosa]|nr:Hpt domain-containing protein [Pseudomonas aeruginosa]
MPQDMSQFLQVFFEETEEHLATLELLLIGLDLDRPDSETLHGIFRAAHSIKGSSGMFGFDDITAVTHELETLLDRIRCGQMGLRPDMISSFLEARDVLQRLLDAHRSGRPDPGVPLLETVERLRGWLRAPEQEAAEAGFGLFDDAPTSPARETADDDAFGFFDEGPGAPERAAAPEAFGLFDEAPGAPAASEAFGLFDDAPGSPPTEERAFGLFDGAPGSPAAPSAPAQAVAAPARGAVAPVRGDGESGSIRVSVEKIDSLINLVGELVITQAMLGQLGEQLDPSHHERLQHALAQLEHNTRDLQESVMSIRMLPINFIFSRFPRLVRDTATRLGKQVELHLHGEHTELDKSVIEKLSDPLTHIVR